MKGSGAVVEQRPPHKEIPKPSPVAIPRPQAPRVAPAEPKSSPDVLAMHSAYGNAAVARAATTGELAPAAPKPAPAPAAPPPSDPPHDAKTADAASPAAKTSARPAAAKGPAGKTDKPASTPAESSSEKICGVQRKGRRKIGAIGPRLCRGRPSSQGRRRASEDSRLGRIESRRRARRRGQPVQ